MLQNSLLGRLVGRWVLVLGSTAVCGCEVVHGSGRVVEEERDVSGFERIVLRGEGDIDFEQTEDTGLVVEAEDNIVPELATNVEGRTLIIETRGDVILDPTRPIIYHVGSPKLTLVAIEGSGNFGAEHVDSESLRVEISGSGNGHVQKVEADAVELEISGTGELKVDDLRATTSSVVIEGSGDVDIDGTARTQTVTITGSGNYFGFGCDTEDTVVRVSGSGNVDVSARDSLTVRVDGSGDVRFKGSPRLDSSVSGSGTVSQR